MTIWTAHPGTDPAPALAAAAEALERGGVVAIPTETFYGLAASLRRPEALDRVRELKGRQESDKPLLLLVRGLDQARSLASSSDDALDRLAERFWPGPLTIVLPARAGLPTAVVSASGGVGVRCTSHPLAQALLERVSAPLSGTSANRSGSPPVTHADAIDVPGLDGILDGGRTPGEAASTLLDLTGDRARILRPGPVGREALTAVLGDRLL